MGRCASVVLVLALMCAACVGASADPGDSAAALDGSPACSVDHVIVGVGNRGGLCVAFKKSSVANPEPGLDQPLYSVALFEMMPDGLLPLPYSEDVKCEMPAYGTVPYNTLASSWGVRGTFIECAIVAPTHIQSRRRLTDCLFVSWSIPNTAPCSHRLLRRHLPRRRRFDILHGERAAEVLRQTVRRAGAHLQLECGTAAHTRRLRVRLQQVRTAEPGGSASGGDHEEEGHIWQPEPSELETGRSVPYM